MAEGFDLSNPRKKEMVVAGLAWEMQGLSVKYMKICYLGNGESIHMRRWMEYFVNKGHEIHLITFSSPEIEGISIHRLDTSYIEALPAFLRKIIRSKRIRETGWKAVKMESKITRKNYLAKIAKWRFIPQIRGLIKSIKPDILNAHSLDVYGFLASMVDFHPFVATPWGSDVLIEPGRSLLARWQVKHAIKKADLITPDTISVQNGVNTLYRREKKITLIQFGVDTRNVVSEKEKSGIRNKICSKLNIPKTAKIIICPRGFRSIYNAKIILEAAVELLKMNNELYFIFLGYSDKYSYLKTIIEDNKAADNVKFLEQVKHDEIFDYYRVSDILVSIPSSDSISVSLLEGMFYGCIPVVSDLAANREWITHKSNGIIVKIRKDSLVDGVLWVLDNKSKWDKMKSYNSNIVKEKADHETNMNKMENLYKELVN